MRQIVLLHPSDNVVTSLAALKPGASVSVETPAGEVPLVVRDAVPYAHKLALKPMAAGAKVIKYGEVIGVASRAIDSGEWVHVHNVESARARGDRTGDQA